MCDSGKIRSIWRRTRNADLEFIGKAEKIKKNTAPKKKKKKKQKKGKKKVARTFVVNGKKRTYRGPRILVCGPNCANNGIEVAEFSASRVAAKEKQAYNFQMLHEVYQDIEQNVPSKTKKKKDIKFRDFTAGILRTNARLKEERKSSSPNVRLASKIEASEIRAEI